ncbi:MAG TPA: glucose-1-phosphate cytidylyltransferase [Acidimicrobiales bacterium]|nr:glucose-1-phosphate cytidylyltransferase [Acidimicrobiales bacterium]
MKAVILAGGLGTRLREETEFRPKPMVEVGGKPILWHIMKNLAEQGISDFIICTGYRGNIIKEYFLNYEALNNDFTLSLGNKREITFHGAHLESEWKVTVVDTGLETMTGGRVKRIEPFIADQPFLVTYGDGLADIDLAALVAFHGEHGRLATLTTVQPLTRFGIVDLDERGKVCTFREKPKSEDWVSAGFFIFDRKVFDYIGPDCVLEQEPLEALAKDGELMAYRHRGFWQPMDTFRELTLLSGLWEAAVAPWKTWKE